MPAFSDRIWATRLQMLWIVFTAAYFAIGQFTTRPVVSSILVLCGGVLVAGALGHILLERDPEKARPLLIVAMTATFFLARESSNTFRDDFAALFSLLFAAMFAHLLWSGDEGVKTQLRKYKYFTMMILVLSSGVVMLAATLVQQRIQTIVGWSGYILFAPIGSGIIAGLAVGYLLAGRVLPDVMPDFEHYAPKSMGRVAFEGVLFAVLGAWFLVHFNQRRLDLIVQDRIFFVPLAALSLSALIFASMPALCMLFRKPGQIRFGRLGAGALLIAACVVGGTIIAAFEHAMLLLISNDPGSFLVRWLAFGLVSGVGFGAAVCLWIYLCKRVALHLYRQASAA